MESTHCPQEVELLKLLKELQSILTVALNSLGNKMPLTLESHYLGCAATSVNYATDGYIFLREPGRIHASKLLIRPILEAVISAMAVMEKRGILFQKYYTEWANAKKLFSKDAAYEAKAKQYLEDLKRNFKQEDPSYPIKCKELRISEMAEAAKMQDLYKVAYSAYCEFTHGSMRAVVGELNNATDVIDTSIVISCVLAMLDQLQKHTPATVPNLASFVKRQEAHSMV
jgi:hypothetical protein